MEAMDDHIAANRANWDDRARLHATDQTGSYSIESVVAGGSSLHDIEAREIGDVAGRRLVHLQCHIGLDTISLAALGAEATGLDFSAEAVAAARGFAARAGRSVRFVESDVHDAPAALGATYEIAYVTWGAINWLPDIGRWARIVADVLEPGGFLYLAESHPSTLCLEEIEGRIVPHYDWRTPIDRPIATDSDATYTGDTRPVAHRRTYEWIHPLSDIVGALAAAGLRLDWLREHEELPYRLFPRMVPAAGRGLFRLPDGDPRLALSFSLKATRGA
jgi:SAM-dependent methyltransferase